MNLLIKSTVPIRIPFLGILIAPILPEEPLKLLGERDVLLANPDQDIKEPAPKL